jgi:hypothetical protein
MQSSREVAFPQPVKKLFPQNFLNFMVNYTLHVTSHWSLQNPIQTLHVSLTLVTIEPNPHSPTTLKSDYFL